MLLQTVLGADFYQLLEIQRNADQSEIKRAYRKQSLVYHPDKNPGKSKVLSAYIGDEDAASKFAQIARAYEVLSDETKR